MKPLTAAEWLKKNYPHATGWHEDYAEEYAQYIAAFPKWVDVKRQKPRYRINVLCWNPIKERSEVGYYQELEFWNDTTDSIINVTHWQPLPELPITEQTTDNE